MEYIVEKLDADNTTPTMSVSETRVCIWKDTRARASRYAFAESIKVTYEINKKLAKIYSFTHIEVTPEDTLVAGKRLIDAGYNPCILNFADDLDAGGVVDNGNSAQEESLWRRTNLCMTQLQTFYPLVAKPFQEGIYTPCATVFKDTEANNHADLENPWTAAFISVPGLKHPRTNKQDLVCLEDMMLMRQKIELILQTAKHYGHDSLVLGALGCGVWRAPPRHIAEIFRSLLFTYNGVFKHITFACLTDGPAASHSNYAIFKSVFESPAMVFGSV